MTESRTAFCRRFKAEIAIIEREMAVAAATLGDRALAKLGLRVLALDPASKGRDVSKRLRGSLLLLSQRAAGCPGDLSKVAASAEIVHAASLVVDDIQDRHSHRNKEPALWTEFGESEAFNVALMLVTLAASFCHEIKGASEGLLLTVRKMLVGQSEDLRAKEHYNEGLSAYRRVVSGKTAALLEFACTAGVSCLPTSDVENMRRFAHALGVAHQIQDDVDDLVGDDVLPESNVFWFLGREKALGSRENAIAEALALAEAETRKALAHLSQSNICGERGGELRSLARIVGLRHQHLRMSVQQPVGAPREVNAL